MPEETIMYKERYAVGFDIGGTKLAVVLAEQYGPDIRILDKVIIPTPRQRDGGWEEAFRELCHAYDMVLERTGISRESVEAIGISCGGPLDAKGGLILSPPNLPGWDEVPIVDLTERTLGRPAFLQNDANACALAEYMFGAGRGETGERCIRNMIFLTFGTGFGAGLILDGRLYAGTNDMAGEIGHCLAPQGRYSPVGYGKAGSYEGYCSGGGIAGLARLMAQEALQRGERPSFCPDENALVELTAKSVAQAAEQGEPLAMQVYEASGTALGHALASAGRFAQSGVDRDRKRVCPQRTSAARLCAPHHARGSAALHIRRVPHSARRSRRRAGRRGRGVRRLLGA